MQSLNIFLLLWFSFLGITHGRKEEIDVSSSAVIIHIGDPFGSSAFGNHVVDLKVEPSDVVLSYGLYTEKQMDASDDAEYYEYANPCFMPSVIRKDFNGSLIDSYVFPQVDSFQAVVINCQKLELSLSGSIHSTLLNGDELSLNEKPLFAVYSSYMGIYAFSFCFYGALCFLLRRGYAPLHTLLLGYLVLKTAEMVASTFHMSAYENSGDYVSDFFYLYKWLRMLGEILLLLGLVLISVGWHVILARPPLSPRELKVISSLFFFLLLFNTLNIHCERDCAVYQLFGGMFEFLLKFGVIIAMNANIEKLRQDSQEEASIMHIGTSCSYGIFLSFRNLKIFRMAFVPYIVVPVLLVVLEYAVLSWRQSWLVFMLKEGLLYLVVVTVALTFLPKRLDNLTVDFNRFLHNTRSSLQRPRPPRSSQQA
eukprot:GCRY01001664.1.p1 GENE.GCRY01001664.1~~GCRY01001664.1.p1  ORF type:complete len:423 (+),score=106.09 GCRY01001664.1:233-1501(+)